MVPTAASFFSSPCRTASRSTESMGCCSSIATTCGKSHRSDSEFFALFSCGVMFICRPNVLVLFILDVQTEVWWFVQSRTVSPRVFAMLSAHRFQAYKLIYGQDSLQQLGQGAVINKCRRQRLSMVVSCSRRVASSSDTQHIRHSRLLAISGDSCVHALGADKASFRAVLSHCQSICPKRSRWYPRHGILPRLRCTRWDRDQPQVRGRPHAQSADHCLHVIARGAETSFFGSKQSIIYKKKKYLQKISSTSVLADWSGRPTTEDATKQARR